MSVCGIIHFRCLQVTELICIIVVVNEYKNYSSWGLRLFRILRSVEPQRGQISFTPWLKPEVAQRQYMCIGEILQDVFSCSSPRNWLPYFSLLMIYMFLFVTGFWMTQKLPRLKETLNWRKQLMMWKCRQRQVLTWIFRCHWRIFRQYKVVMVKL